MDNLDEHVSLLRLKIRFPTNMALQSRFPYYREDGESIWIGFKYERLSSFCVHCGHIDHTVGVCFQNPVHPQSFALIDKLRGHPPTDPIMEVQTIENSRDGSMVEKWMATGAGPTRPFVSGIILGQKHTGAVLATREEAVVVSSRSLDGANLVAGSNISQATGKEICQNEDSRWELGFCAAPPEFPEFSCLILTSNDSVDSHNTQTPNLPILHPEMDSVL